MVEQTNRQLGETEFTHRWYREFLEGLRADGYEFRMFWDELGDGDIVLRHDMDLSVEAAVRMARIEADLGVRSTYCVLLTSSLYNPLESEHREALRELRSLGHEVVLHFSTHEYWAADAPPKPAVLERQVGKEQAVLETILPTTETVSFHRPPSWVLDRTFDGFRNAYAPTYFDDIEYVADSGQRWRSEPPRIDDRSGPMQVLTHPGLWAEDDGTFEARVEEAIDGACDHTDRDTRAEFIDGEAT